MMFADLVDEIDFVQRLQTIGFVLHPGSALDELIQQVNTQLQDGPRERTERLQTLVGELMENRGLVLPEIIDSLQWIQWPQGE